MAMSVGGDSATETPMSDINTTPLVDVMLVLLIIFLIAIPVVIQSVDVDLPKVEFEPTTTKPENISLAVRGGAGGGECEVYWNQTRVNSEELLQRGVQNLEGVVARFGDALTPEDIPEVHIRGDVNTPYRCIGGAVYTMQSAGFVKVGFISEPAAGTGGRRV